MCHQIENNSIEWFFWYDLSSIKMAVYDAPFTLRNCHRLPDKLFCFHRGNLVTHISTDPFFSAYKMYKAIIKFTCSFLLFFMNEIQSRSEKMLQTCTIFYLLRFLFIYKNLNQNNNPQKIRYLYYFFQIIAPLK